MSLMNAPRLPILALALGLAAWAPAASAAKLADPDAPGLSLSARQQALFERVRQEQGSMHSLEARFVQLKESEMFVKPVEAEGVFSFLAPDRVRWEFTSPNPMTVLIDRDKMTTWYRDLGRADVMNVGRYSGQVLKYLGASGSLETLLEYFDVSTAFPKDPTDPYHLTLEPRYPRIAKHIDKIDVWIDRTRFVPVRLRYVEPGGDVTEYRFSDLKVNATIPPARFHLDLPDRVERRTLSADHPSE